MGPEWAEPESAVNLRHVSASSPDIPLPDMMAHFTLPVCPGRLIPIPAPAPFPRRPEILRSPRQPREPNLIDRRSPLASSRQTACLDPSGPRHVSDPSHFALGHRPLHIWGNRRSSVSAALVRRGGVCGHGIGVFRRGLERPGGAGAERGRAQDSPSGGPLGRRLRTPPLRPLSARGR